MSIKLLSLIAIATLTSFAAQAAEEVEKSPLMLEEQTATKEQGSDHFAADAVILEEQLEEGSELAGCGCGKPRIKKKKRDHNQNSKAETSEVLSSCCPETTKTDEELLEEVKLASCPAEKAATEEELLEEAKLASCPAEKTATEEELIEEAKLA